MASSVLVTDADIQHLNVSMDCIQMFTNNTSFQFGKWPICHKEVFYVSPCSYGFVNESPLVPGHILVSPRRRVDRFYDLTFCEVQDLMHSVQILSKVMELKHHTTALNVSLQDGKDAGQTVDHVHIHILPRRPNDFAKHDEVHEALEMHDANRESIGTANKEHRQKRTTDEMYAEAEDIRNFILSVINRKPKIPL